MEPSHIPDGIGLCKIADNFIIYPNGSRVNNLVVYVFRF